MKTAALIACNNGYGHLRRLLIIYESLRKTNICPTIFAPIYKVKHLSKILKIKHVKKINPIILRIFIPFDGLNSFGVYLLLINLKFTNA